MTIVDRDGVEIAYDISGIGDITLLFVHGSFIDKSYWSEQVEYFKQHYHVLTVDLPGHGKSGKNREHWSIQEYGNDLCTLIHTLKLKKVILIGHSMGGDVMLETAVKCTNSVIGIVGIDNFKNAGTAMPAEIQKQADQIIDLLKVDFANTSESFARMALLSADTDHSIADRVVSDFRNMDKTIGVQLISDAFTYYKRERELLSEIKYKLYLINADNIPTNEEPLKQYTSFGYEIVPIKGTCHYPMIENPNEFNQTLHHVIAQIEANL